MLLQMPIMMGLYYALQESILFRLGSFWPTWITNLAAPDMMIYWTQSIPWISQPEAFGGFIYLGPYLNLLPIIAVSLMLVQQRMYTPPPADEQQETQQTMMNFMMIFMGLMFYKVAAGLCVYFIASSLWGFAERRLLPKRKDPDSKPELAVVGGDSLALNGPNGSTALTATGQQPTPAFNSKSKKANRKRKNERSGASQSTPTGTPDSKGAGGWLRAHRERLTNWWNGILDAARKK
jgi:YidC/Oxa1 family membrane protein insertase